MRTDSLRKYFLIKIYKSLTIPIILGAVVYLIIVGLAPLNPRNIAWLDGGFDPSLHYIAWEFYRNSPWTSPIGLNPAYGLEASSSIVYSDSIPLIAIALKVFSPILGEPFQYIGIWILVCFVLQSCFSWKLARLYTNDRRVLVLVTLFFLFSPPMLWRLGEHAALFGHFIITCALYLALRKSQNKRMIYWVALVAGSFLVNIYIAAPIAAIWFADILDKRFRSRCLVTYMALVEIFLVITVSIFLIWQSGYLSVGAGSISGRDYGFRQLNILSLFNSAGWSYFISPISFANPAFEGFNYLGSGVLLLLPFVVYGVSKNQLLSKSSLDFHFFLAICFACLTLFALSNYISVGRWQLYIPMPDSLIGYAGMLRSSGRIFWPVYYFLMIAILLGVVWGFSRPKALFLLSVALVIQVVDTSSGWLPKKNAINHSYANEWKNYLPNLQWSSFAPHYRAVIVVPLVRSVLLLPEDWQVFANYALNNQMGTNSVYMGRYDDTKLGAANAKYEAAIASGDYDLETLYIIDDERVMPVLMNLDPHKDLFAKVDGFNVLAPGWTACDRCAQPPKESLITKSYPKIQMNESIGFGKGENGTPFLIGIDQRQIKGWGWGYPEKWGVWSEGYKAKVVLPIPKGNPKSLVMDFRAFITASHPKQVVEILINNAPNQVATFSKDQENKVIIHIPESMKQKYIAIELRLPDSKSPKDLGIGDDIRQLGVGLTKVEFR